MGTFLAISSSPRRCGNSELLLQSFNRGLQKEGCNVNTIRISDLAIKPCQACDLCATTGECILQDDMQNIYPQIVSARGLVIATPIYFGTLPAQLKIFIDRFQCWWHAKYKLNEPPVKLEEGRPGFFICVGALKNKDYFQNSLAAAQIYFHIVNYHLSSSLYYNGVDEKGAIKEHPDALQKAFEAGRRFAACSDQQQQ